jgi:hypothetical protein
MSSPWESLFSRLCRSSRAAYAPFATFAVLLALDACAEVRLDPLHGGKWPAFNAGSVVDIAVEDGLAYVALSEGGLSVFDISIPENVTLLAEYNPLEYVAKIFVTNRHAYILVGRGFEVLQLDSANRLRLLGRYALNGAGYDLQVAGQVAFVPFLGRGVLALDVSDPADIKLVGQYNPAGTNTFGMYVVNSRAFLLQQPLRGITSKLTVLDISDPAHMAVLGERSLNFEARFICAEGSFVYISGFNAFQVFDAANPSAIVPMGRDNRLGFAYDLAVAGGYAYIAGGINQTTNAAERYGLRILDVRNPLTVRPVIDVTNAAGRVLSVCVKDNLALVSAVGSGLRVLNVSNPSNVVTLDTVDMSVMSSDLQLANGHAFIADTSRGLQAIDVRDPEHLKPVGRSEAIEASRIEISGNTAVVLTYGNGIRIFDISDPQNMVRLSSLAPERIGTDLRLRWPYAYIAYSSNASQSVLQILDIQNPSNPIVRKEYVTNDIRGVDITRKYAYLARGDAGVDVLDISDPADPKSVLTYSEARPIHGLIRISGSYAFALSGQISTLDVMDISLPTEIRRVRVGNNPDLRVNGPVSDMDFRDSLLYLATFDALRIFDIGNVSNIVLRAVFKSRFTALGVVPTDHAIFVAAGEGGLISVPSLPNFQFTLQAQGTPGALLTIEAATSLTDQSWTTVFTTNAPAEPFLFTDRDVSAPRKFYRARQP